MRARFSRTPRSARPKGEATTRLSTRKSAKRTTKLYTYAVRPERSKANTPKSFPITTPESPSTPPVMCAARLAAS
jgi:hypothetical protein